MEGSLILKFLKFVKFMLFFLPRKSMNDLSDSEVTSIFLLGEPWKLTLASIINLPFSLNLIFVDSGTIKL